jgi:aspartate aminotransferase-like enzyme
MRDSVIRWTMECQNTGSAVSILAPENSRSSTVSTLTLPVGVSGDMIVNKVAERGFVVGNGYGALKDRTFRIGHMGEHRPEGLALCLDACAWALEECSRV